MREGEGATRLFRAHLERDAIAARVKEVRQLAAGALDCGLRARRAHHADRGVYRGVGEGGVWVEWA